MQSGIVQQRREFGSVGHGKWLKVKSLSRPAPVKVDHPSTIAAGQPPAWRPDSRQMRIVTPRVPVHGDRYDSARPFAADNRRLADLV
jgi:hypothetical protein